MSCDRERGGPGQTERGRCSRRREREEGLWSRREDYRHSILALPGKNPFVRMHCGRATGHITRDGSVFGIPPPHHGVTWGQVFTDGSVVRGGS